VVALRKTRPRLDFMGWVQARASPLHPRSLVRFFSSATGLFYVVVAAVGPGDDDPSSLLAEALGGAPPPKLDDDPHRANIVLEILQTEKTYVAQVSLLIKVPSHLSWFIHVIGSGIHFMPVFARRPEELQRSLEHALHDMPRTCQAGGHQGHVFQRAPHPATEPGATSPRVALFATFRASNPFQLPHAIQTLLKGIEERVNAWSPKQKLGDVFETLVIASSLPLRWRALTELMLMSTWA